MLYNNPNHQANNEENEKIGINDFIKIEKIGTGQFSTVYKVKNIKDGNIYAMKVIEKRPESEEEEQKKQIKREFRKMLSLEK